VLDDVIQGGLGRSEAARMEDKEGAEVRVRYHFGLIRSVETCTHRIEPCRTK
jgi:hypothetical protein